MSAKKPAGAPAAARPTREQLVALLFSDPASEAWDDDAKKILETARAPGDGRGMEGELSVLEHVLDVLNVVGSELDGSAGDGLAGDSEDDDLRGLACMAKRGAILLLHAAAALARRRRADEEAESPMSGLRVQRIISFLAGGAPVYERSALEGEIVNHFDLPAERVREAIADAEKQGLISRDGNLWQLTPMGRASAYGFTNQAATDVQGDVAPSATRPWTDVHRREALRALFTCGLRLLDGGDTSGAEELIEDGIPFWGEDGLRDRLGRAGYDDIIIDREVALVRERAEHPCRAGRPAFAGERPMVSPKAASVPPTAEPSGHVLRAEPAHLGQCENCGLSDVAAGDPCSVDLTEDGLAVVRGTLAQRRGEAK